MEKAVWFGWRVWLAALFLVPLLIFGWSFVPNLLDSGFNGILAALIFGLCIVLLTTTALLSLRKRKKKGKKS